MMVGQGSMRACQQPACTRLVQSVRGIRGSGHFHRRSRRGVQIVAWGKKTGVETKQAIPSSPFPSQLPLADQPWFIQGGAAILALTVGLKLFKKLTNKGSMGSLESRGLVLEGEQSTKSSDAYYNRMMKHVNTVQYQELSDDQIKAARQRRSMDRKNDERVDLTKIQLPSNHPFAVSKQVTDEEEQLQMARLSVRRGMPLKDLSELRGRQGRLGAQMPSSELPRDGEAAAARARRRER